jgi:hypothetical protein
MAGRWARLLLGFSIALLAAGLLSMHQLSLDHALVTPTLPTAEHLHAHGRYAPHLPMHGTAANPASSSTQPLAAFPRFAPSGVEGCAGECGQHNLLLTSCVLALSLLILGWRLRPPRCWIRPASLRRAVPRVTGSLGRLRPSLTLAELTVRRT